MRPAWAAVFLAIASSARAEDQPTPSELALARTEYRRGVEASKKELWEEAYAAFFRAFELSQRPAILLNLGSAQAKTGRLVEARESYQGFLREAPKAEVAKHRADAELVLKQLEQRIPKAVITVDGLEAQDRLVIDDQEVAKAVLSAELPLNPGRHVIDIMREDAVAASAEISLLERETQTVRLDATRPPVIEPPVVIPPKPPIVVERPRDVEQPREESGLLESPIFWISAAAVAVGGAIAIGFAVNQDAPGYSGSTGIVFEAP